MFAPDRPLKVGILGATGLVGQRLVSSLAEHPWFEAAVLGASERSTGRRYEDAVRWSLAGAIPPRAAALPVDACDPTAFTSCDVVVSSLDTAVARTVERRFVDAGFAVVSNSSAFRLDPRVPLIVPEVNADHAGLVAAAAIAGEGFLVTNPNCSVTGLAMVLAPIHRAFGIRRVFVATLQALSGAGVDGPSALAMADNVVPFIPGEEDKIHLELGKLLGSVDAAGTGFEDAEIPVSAHCHRVGTVDGHLEAVSLDLERSADPDRVIDALRSFRGAIDGLGLPSAPDPPVVVRDEPDRPQPRLDRDEGAGMATVVGRVRACVASSIRLELLSHNTVRGAAGAAILNMELLAARGWISRSRGA